MISLQGIERVFRVGGEEVHALRGVAMDIAAGEYLSIMGPSGSGKSTLLNLICGLDEPSSGTIAIDGVNIAQLGDDARTRLRREKIGMIFQTFNLLPTLTALENVSLPLRLNGLSRKDAEQRASAMLERVGLGKRAAHRPDEMSGGERQRIAIARALIFKPPVLLADEPTGNLDPKTSDKVFGALLEIVRSEGLAALIATHDSRLARKLDRVIVIRDQRLVEVGHASLDA